jgi:hypothetical protein
VTKVGAATAELFSVNVAPVAPAGMVRLPGTPTTAVLLLEIATVAPPLGAGALRVTAPVAEKPPLIVVGFSESELRIVPDPPGVIAREAVFDVAFAPDADMVTEVDAETGVVAIWKVAAVLPAATVMLPGTVAAAVLLLVNEIIAPAPGAAAFRTTVPVEELPPFTAVGFSASELITGLLGGGTCGAPELLPPPLQDPNVREIATSAKTVR